MRNFTFKVIPVPPEPSKKNGGKVENTEGCPAPYKPYPPPPQAPMPCPPQKPCPTPPEPVLPAPPETPLPCPPTYSPYPQYPQYPQYPSSVLPSPPEMSLPYPPTYPSYPPHAYPPPYPQPPFRLAHAYVPWQYYNVVYSPAEALSRGTLFPDLYQPQGEYGPCEGPQPCSLVFPRGGASYGS
ncbi:spore coat associated protein CotJA [Thermanaerosceptrum fracticalcis]|uniref:Spore coat associated protein CotJA n=1 Tax=Thermanaerosceptrum fracticalcis TaxID=1712410 RepID=A0A7G6E5F3_THEFR|nr:spore coat associated protein CotJA [Thermanaerosceptrum fracticalcis]QNB47307.1 spore coat associated protein CotJA [Thermanaerosceptrum fracticalcis]